MKVENFLKIIWPFVEAIGWASLHFITLVICTLIISFVFGYMPCGWHSDDCLQKQFGVFLSLYFGTMIVIFYKDK